MWHSHFGPILLVTCQSWYSVGRVIRVWLAGDRDHWGSTWRQATSPTRNNIVVVFVIHWHESATGVHVSPSPRLLPPSHPIPLGCPSVLALSALFHASNLDWSSISHMVIHMFQCCSLKSSHPHLLPQSPEVSSIYLSFVVSCTGSSLPSFSIPYICVNILYWCFSFLTWLHSV